MWFDHYAMSIRDKIRDDLYGSEADERKSEATASALSEFTDTMDRPFAAQMRLGVAVLIEALCIGAILVFPRQVYMIGVAALAYVAMAVFAVGAVIGFTASTLLYQWSQARDSMPVEDGDLMSGFEAEERRQSQFQIWFAAAAAGIANFILLYALLQLRN